MIGCFFASECYRVYISNDRQLGTNYTDTTRQMFKDRMSVEQIVDYNKWREGYDDVAIPLWEQAGFPRERINLSESGP